MAVPVIPRPPVPAGEVAMFFKHICPPTFGGGPVDPQPATVELARNLLVGEKFRIPDGRDIDIWIIEDPDDNVGGRVFPSKAIRVNQGDTVRVRVGSQGDTHTIHWHGIEPSPVNDGVGKHSFEVSGNFVYQFTPRQAGTYFYHCHKNTTLHVEMGLYGLLIVDPPGSHPNFLPRQSFTGGPFYHVEAFWVSDEFDTRWHTLGHDAFMQDCVPDDPVGPQTFSRDGFLNQFKPDVFLITGVARTSDATPIADPRVAVSARVGQTILIRTLNAGYTVQQYTIYGLPATVIAADGRPLGATPETRYSAPFVIPAGRPFRLTSGRRFDLILKPTRPGVYPATVEYFDWITGRRYAVARTTITVNR